MRVSQSVLSTIARIVNRDSDEWKDSQTDVRDALLALANGLIDVQKQLNASHEDLNRTGGNDQIRGLVFPEGSNQPPLADTVRFRTFYNTSRKRPQGSTDTFPYYDLYTPESCRLYNTADIATADNVALALTFNIEIFDHYNMADLATQPTRITIPLDGRYLVGGYVAFESNAVGRRALTVQKNGATNIVANNQMAVTTATFLTRLSVATVYEFVTGDYVQLLALQNSGGALNVVSEAETGPIFYCHRLG